jgi:hypothetical protein
MDKITLKRRGDYMDILYNGKHIASGTWAFYPTAVYFYRAEGMEVEVKE